MSNSNQRSASSGSRKAFTHNEGNGSLFYDAPGAPTLSGSFASSGNHAVTGEPAVDRNQREYIRISGQDVSGALYVNDRKEQDRHPDYTGPIEIKGRKMRMSAWRKQTKTGENAGQDFLSIAISEPRQSN